MFMSTGNAVRFVAPNRVAVDGMSFWLDAHKHTKAGGGPKNSTRLDVERTDRA